ncbi:MAG: type II toxin-antitoxin system RelE/ParE family toxin [Parcubacteria group bacterium]|nr:type II toxin-antitoxin system RelE/ParE family toxin [Parcubacteria group bacterium]
MIRSFTHKGLEDFFLMGRVRGIQIIHTKKVRLILAVINSAHNIKDINFHGSYLHKLKGAKQNLWAVKVDGNWRITFRFENEDAYILDYLDYH